MLSKLLLTAVLLLAACGTAPHYDKLEVKNTEVKYITLPDELLAPCVPAIPISEPDYLTLKPFEREEYLTKYTVSLLTTIKDCNINLSSARKLNQPPK